MKKSAKRSKRKASVDASSSFSFQLPAHWPSNVTPEYYAWMMARMPVGAIPADWSKHHPNNSSGPFWYEDKPQTCASCGVQFVFTKEEQQAWYEEYRIPIYAYANRCQSCLRERRRLKVEQRKHMAELASREPHPHEAFFKPKP